MKWLKGANYENPTRRRATRWVADMVGSVLLGFPAVTLRYHRETRWDYGTTTPKA